MKIEPHSIAREHVEKNFSPWGAIHPSSIHDYPEVFEFSITSKAFLEGTGEGPIGLGPGLISKRTGRIQQYGSGQFYSLLDFLIKEEKCRIIEERNVLINLDLYYQLDILEVIDQTLFDKYFKAFVLNYPFRAHKGGEEVSYREWLFYKEQLVILWKKGKMKIPPMKGEFILDFIFYNSIHSFCHCDYVQIGDKDKESKDEIIDISWLPELKSNKDNEIDLLKSHVKNIDKLTWTQVSNFGTFILFNFYAKSGISLIDDIQTSSNDDSLILNLKNDEILYFNFLNSIDANYLSTYLFIEYEEEEIPKVIQGYKGVRGRSIVIEKIYDYELLVQHFMFLKSKFYYNIKDPNYSSDPDWNWQYYYSDKEQLEKQLDQLPARFSLDDYESCVFFLYSNAMKNFCELIIER